MPTRPEKWYRISNQSETPWALAQMWYIFEKRVFRMVCQKGV